MDRLLGLGLTLLEERIVKAVREPAPARVADKPLRNGRTRTGGTSS
jgi:hypothetical protein